MPHPYSEDLRLRVVQAVENGQTTREVSALFQVSPSFVYQLWRQSGSVSSQPIAAIDGRFWNPTPMPLWHSYRNTRR